jgi:DNA recombination protein RmuC
MSVIVALVVGVLTGALVVWLVMRSQSSPAPAVVQGEIKTRLDDTFVYVQRIAAVFANAAQRGRAGELVLENLLEATGMDRHRDFEVQTGFDGARPDIVLNLPGRGRLVIDSKFPLDDFQRAAAASSEAERQHWLAAHAKAVAAHVSALAKRDYPSKVKGSINFVVCFVPAEDLLVAAYKEQPSLFFDAVRERVLIATPTTLIALLWGVAFGWQQDARVRQAEQIGDIGAELHKRFGPVMSHLAKTGRQLNSAVNNYNALIGSFESRIMPQMRKLEGLGILIPGTELPDPLTIETHARPIPAGFSDSAGDLPDDEAPVIEMEPRFTILAPADPGTD